MSRGAAPAIVWFRDDLRLADNPALQAAVASGRRLICLYVHDEQSPGLRALGGASRWWLHGALTELNEALGGHLTILRGDAATIVQGLAADTKAVLVVWNRRYDEAGRAVDTALKTALRQSDIAAESFNGTLLHEPWEVASKSGTPFQVFTAYWRAARQELPAPPLDVPAPLKFHAVAQTLRPADLALEPTAPDWAGGLRTAWQPGEAAGQRCLAEFLEDGLAGYAAARDRPDRPGTSRLSPYLRFGHLSPRQIWHAAESAGGDLDKFRAELGWREFSYHLLYHRPDLARINVQRQFDAMPWRDDEPALAAWQQGRTGYPIVDAGMRQLWTTGWMHNRVRMVAASFLTKHLLLDWRIGEAWFWDTLVDADPANNPASWQWVAGSGADAAPYFRVFNPTLQGEKFDPAGDYVRRWVQELARLPTAKIHRPWTVGADLRGDYPLPIVDHDMARRRALAAWQTLRSA